MGERQLEKEKTSDVGTKKCFYVCFVNILVLGFSKYRQFVLPHCQYMVVYR